jgi:uncharacterized protein (DUF1501 family)
MNRRVFLKRSGISLGTLALADLLRTDLVADNSTAGLPSVPHFKPTAKRVIYLFQSGGPSQLDLFDYKPKLRDLQGSELPASVRRGQRITTMTSIQQTLPVLASKFKFAQHGRSGAWLSELLPRTAKIADELCFIKSMYTEAINHDPAITLVQTGSEQPGRPSLGAWMSYGLGSMSKELPAFVVLISPDYVYDQPLYDRLWGTGFLPSHYQGVKLRSAGDPVLYLSNPPGVSSQTRRRQLDDLAELNKIKLEGTGDAEIATRITQYELAYRMQTSVPKLMDLSQEPAKVIDAYGPGARTPGTFAANCLLARRLAERGVRFIQLYHKGWDQHRSLASAIAGQCAATDQASAALIQDLMRCGLLKDTLVIWGGEFGRTTYCQGKLDAEDNGRDHHPRCFTYWLAGGGIKPGMTYGETDDFSYNISQDAVHVHDLNATILHCLGIDHERLTYRHQGRDFRLTDVAGNVEKKLLA